MFHRSCPRGRSSLVVAAAAIAAGLLVCRATSAQSVVVDGDCADLAAIAGVSAEDRAFDVAPALRSGFDFTRVFVHYSPKRDTLFLGLDLLDSLEGPGVAGDADGDSNPHDRTHPAVREDQTGVGPNEYYVFEIDTDQDGAFTGYDDLRVVYKANRLRLERGTGDGAAPGLSGRVAIGTRGVPFDSHLPNQNRATEDIEIAVAGYANQDNTPGSFHLRVTAGSSVDSLPDDVSDDGPIGYELGSVLELRTEFADPDQRTLGRCAVAFPGDVVSVAAIVTNNGFEPFRPAWLIFHFPTGLDYVPGSVRGAAEGKMIPRPDGLVVRFVRPGGDTTLEPGETARVTFDIAVVSFPACHMTVRGFAEGMFLDGITCAFSSTETICFVE